MSLLCIRKSQITEPVRLVQGVGDSATEYMPGVTEMREELAQAGEWEAKLRRAGAVQAAVVALGVAEVQRWREMELANEPRRAWMARHGSMTPAWIGVLYDRAVLGVAVVGGVDGGTVEMPVAEYWARERVAVAGVTVKPQLTLTDGGAV